MVHVIQHDTTGFQLCDELNFGFFNVADTAHCENVCIPSSNNVRGACVRKYIALDSVESNYSVAEHSFSNFKC